MRPATSLVDAATLPTVRLLPPEEWGKLLAQGLEPWTSGGLPDPDHWHIVVAEDAAGTIVGFCGMYETVHYEPIWINPEWRRHPAVFGRLWRESRAILDAAGVQLIHATVPDDLPLQQTLVERFGFTPAAGKLYLLYVPDSPQT